MKFSVNRGGKESSAMGTSNAVARDPSISSMAGRVTNVMRGGTGFLSAEGRGSPSRGTGGSARGSVAPP
eukprot:4859566-Prymnesium_polylepis.1